MPRTKKKAKIKQKMAAGWDYDKIRALSVIQCTAEEIAAVLGVTPGQVYDARRRDKDFKEAMDHGRLEGFRSLRRAMWNKALDGDRTMMIWLSKQHLGMRDDQNVTVKHVQETADRYASMTTDELQAEIESLQSEIESPQTMTH